MKNTIYSFQILSLLIILAFSNYSMAQEVSLKKQDVKTKEKITTHFSGHLSGNADAYDDKSRLKSTDVKKMQQIVWDAWKEANNKFSEQKLINLDKLEKANSGKWTLPQELEPNAIMPYYWGYKGDSEPEGGFSLYLYTHGSGDKTSEWRTGINICQKFDDAPCVYFIPQIPNMGDYYRWWQKAKQFAWEKMLRLAFVSGKINPNKVYFFGISEGGYGSQRLASFYADYLAAAGPMAGGEPLKNAPVENCRNIAFSLLTGENDRGFYRNKLTQRTKDAFDKLEKANPGNFIHRIELIPGMGHGIDYKLTTPWLKQYTRNPYPKHVSWENFEMDGIYRDGFYNLFVEERSNDDTQSRTHYEMDIQENNISLKIDLVTYKATEIDPNWGIELDFEKSYQPATKGKVIIYLNDKLVDLNKEITLVVNGKEAFKGKVKPQLKNMVNSCAAFFDPERIYPAAIEVNIADLQ